jgi:hypothetical protein
MACFSFSRSRVKPLLVPEVARTAAKIGWRKSRVQGFGASLLDLWEIRGTQVQVVEYEDYETLKRNRRLRGIWGRPSGWIRSGRGNPGRCTWALHQREANDWL